MAPLSLPLVLLGFMSHNLAVIAQVSGPPGGFSLSASLGEVRAAHTATLLTDGRVLVVGGGQGPDLIDGFWVASGAELFDPATTKFSPAGTSAHDFHTATLLQSGQVLLAGGESGYSGYSPVITPTAELYDPTTGSFQITGSLLFAREYHTATLLKDGRVLIAGGARLNGINWESLPFAEIYDPAAGTFSVTGGMNTARFGHTATLLADGRVLVTGGGTASAEVYDPVAGSFTPIGNMNLPRSYHAATLLLNGQVLISGGSTSAIAEVYDPPANSFQTVGSLRTPRMWHSATRLADGTVLIAGGWDPFSGSFSSAEIYDPTSGSFTRTADMNFDRLMHTATLLSDGSVLVIGGAGIRNNLHLDFVNPAEVYKTGNATGTISASPNPCILTGDLCTSYIKWATSGVSSAQVRVRMGSGPDSLFATSVSCSGTDCAAPWIAGGGSEYTFTLYDCSSGVCTDTNHGNAPVLGTVRVTAQ
jgi:hypothetical protein